MKNLFVRFVGEEEGHDLIEYSLLAAFLGVGSIASMDNLKSAIVNVFGNVATALVSGASGS